MNQLQISAHQTKTSTLVNFITPNQILETFDSICGFQSITRTSMLIRLMKEFISEQSTSIPHQIQSLENLKNGLSKFERNKSEGDDRRNNSHRNLSSQNRFDDRSSPLSFFIDEDMEWSSKPRHSNQNLNFNLRLQNSTYRSQRYMKGSTANR